MTVFNTVEVLAIIAIVTILGLVAYSFHQETPREKILNDCEAHNVYLERNLMMQCNVMRPKSQ